MRTPEEIYLNDPTYRRVVDALEAMMRDMHLTPSEVRECAMLACLHHEQRNAAYIPFEEWYKKVTP